MTEALYKITLQSEMGAVFPPKRAVAVEEPNLKDLIRILCHCVKCVQSHNTKYDAFNCVYLVVTEECYVLYAPLVFNENGDPV